MSPNRAVNINMQVHDVFLHFFLFQINKRANNIDEYFSFKTTMYKRKSKVFFFLSVLLLCVKIMKEEHFAGNAINLLEGFAVHFLYTEPKLVCEIQHLA